MLFVRALLVGGNVNNGRNAGARYCNVNNAPGNANWNIGGAFSCEQKIFNMALPFPCHSARRGGGRFARAKIDRSRWG